MGVPININTESCSAVSSNCVVWQGPDIPCISLCHGDSITNVMYELAVQFCAALDQLKVSGYNIDCLPIAGCAPETFQELFQLVIDTLCNIQTQNGVDGNNGNYTQVVPIPPDPETCVNGGVAITTYNGVTNAVINTYNICNGEDGDNGLQGIQGFRGDYVQTSEATLDQCPTGGIVVTVLSGEDDSIVSEETVCNGALGPVNDSYISNIQLVGNNLTFTGENLAFDGIIDLSSIGGTVTADNGLTKTGSNIQLGGTLIQNTTIDTKNHTLFLTNAGYTAGINSGVLNITETIGENALTITSVGASIQVTSDITAIYAISTSGRPIYGEGKDVGPMFQTTMTTANNTIPVLQLVGQTNGSLATSSTRTVIEVYTPYINGLGNNTNGWGGALIFDRPDPVNLGETGFAVQLGIGVQSPIVMRLNGDGDMQLPEYGVGSFTGTLAYYLGVDSNGNIIEVTP